MFEPDEEQDVQSGPAKSLQSLHTLKTIILLLEQLKHELLPSALQVKQEGSQGIAFKLIPSSK